MIGQLTRWVVNQERTWLRLSKSAVAGTSTLSTLGAPNATNFRVGSVQSHGTTGLPVRIRPKLVCRKHVCPLDIGSTAGTVSGWGSIWASGAPSRMFDERANLWRCSILPAVLFIACSVIGCRNRQPSEHRHTHTHTHIHTHMQTPRAHSRHMPCLLRSRASSANRSRSAPGEASCPT